MIIMWNDKGVSQGYHSNHIVYKCINRLYTLNLYNVTNQLYFKNQIESRPKDITDIDTICPRYELKLEP